MKTTITTLARAAQIAILAGISAIAFPAMAQRDEPPFRSPVPFSTFSNERAAQEKELENNELLKRFAESRARQSTDRYRPIYHFVSPESTLNDPNGLSYWNGKWHLFYQAYPPEDNRQHWGHAISDDLIHWEDLPYAIYPGPERAVFSGSTLVERDRVIAMYHGTEIGNMVAVSSDPLLLNWEKTTTNRAAIPLADSAGLPLPYSVFDPCIWQKDGVYYSLSAGRKPQGAADYPFGTTYLFRSKDLVNWQYLHEFVEGDRFTMVGDDYACPYFWPIGDRYIMPFFSHMSGGQYLLGDYDKVRDKFVVTKHGKFNFGAATPSGVHAPSATPDGEGGVVIIFNINAGKPTGEWNQIMSLPRKLTLVGDDDLRQEPAGDVESLRYNPVEVAPMEIRANQDVVIKTIKGDAMEIYLEIDPNDAPALSFDVLRSPDKQEYTRISFYQERGFSSGRDYRFGEVAYSTYTPEAARPPVPVRSAGSKRISMLSLETANSSLHPDVRPRAPEVAPLMLEEGETLKLRIFIDKSVVEVFANGKQALAARVYPSRTDAVGFSIHSHGKEAFLKSLVSWQMKSIYE